MKPRTIIDAQTHAIETEMWLKESQSIRHSVPQKVTSRPPPRSTFQPRPSPNTTPRTPNASMPLADRSKMNYHKCGKIGHFASQCMTKPQVFSPGHNFKRPPPPVRTLQEEETEGIEMSQEEVQEQIDYEDSAECLQYAEDSDLFKPEEELENTDYL